MISGVLIPVTLKAGAFGVGPFLRKKRNIFISKIFIINPLVRSLFSTDKNLIAFREVDNYPYTNIIISNLE